LRAIEKAERLVEVLSEKKSGSTDKLRRATKRFAKHLKEEFAVWDEKSKKARAKA
jgi:hypothetical protein